MIRAMCNARPDYSSYIRGHAQVLWNQIVRQTQNKTGVFVGHDSFRGSCQEVSTSHRSGQVTRHDTTRPAKSDTTRQNTVKSPGFKTPKSSSQIIRLRYNTQGNMFHFSRCFPVGAFVRWFIRRGFVVLDFRLAFDSFRVPARSTACCCRFL